MKITKKKQTMRKKFCYKINYIKRKKSLVVNKFCIPITLLFQLFRLRKTVSKVKNSQKSKIILKKKLKVTKMYNKFHFTLIFFKK